MRWSAGVSLESINYPGHFLRHQNFRAKLSRFEPSQLFRDDSSASMLGQPPSLPMAPSSHLELRPASSSHLPQLPPVRVQGAASNLDLRAAGEG